MGSVTDRLAKLPSLEVVAGAIREVMGGNLEDDTASAWTEHILNTIWRELRGQSCLVPYGHMWSGREQGEYLVDLAVAFDDDRGEWSGYRGLVLAAECEWGGTKHALWQDFVKLADVRADLKLFVGAAWPKLYAKREELLDAWLAFLRRHVHVPGSERILVVLCEKKESRTAHYGGWILSGETGRHCLWDE